MLKEKQTIYKSPALKVVEIKSRSIICQSEGIAVLYEQILEEGDFEDIE